MDENQFYNTDIPARNEKQIKEKAASSLAMASMIFGIVSIIGTFCCMPFVFSAVGIALALLSKGASKYCSGQAKTGLICSIVGLVTSFVLVIALVVVEMTLLFSNTDESREFWDGFGQSYEQQYENMYGEELPPEVKDFIDSMGSED